MAACLVGRLVILRAAPWGVQRVDWWAEYSVAERDSLMAEVKVGQWAVTMAGPWDFPRAVD